MWIQRTSGFHMSFLPYAVGKGVQGPAPNSKPYINPGNHQGKQPARNLRTSISMVSCFFRCLYLVRLLNLAAGLQVMDDLSSFPYNPLVIINTLSGKSSWNSSWQPLGGIIWERQIPACRMKALFEISRIGSMGSNCGSKTSRFRHVLCALL